MKSGPGTNNHGGEKAKRSGEFELIRKLTAGWRWGTEVVIGPGDDASAVKQQTDTDKLLLQTTDLLIEGVHFRKNWGSPYQLGWKSLAANLSDIAAMGGSPRHAHLNLAIPQSWSEAEILEYQRGFFDLAQRFDVSLLGGDLSASPGPLVISVMVSGETEADAVLRRSGAKPDDIVWVSGHLGQAAGGLALLQRGDALARDSSSPYQELLQAFLQPEPEVELGILCAASRSVRALIDLSDGLCGDLGHILELSRVGAVLREEQLPISDNLRQAANICGLDLLELALRGGEDYRLLGCSSETSFPSFQNLAKEKLDRTLRPIGQIISDPGLYLQRASGASEPILTQAYDHFA